MHTCILPDIVHTYLSWYFFFFFFFSFLCFLFFLCEECPPEDQSIGVDDGTASVSLETSGLTLDSPTTSELSLKRNLSGWERGVSAGVTTGKRGGVSMSRDAIG